MKEELGKYDRMEKRQDLSVEYLKNVVLKFLEASDKEVSITQEEVQLAHLVPSR